MFEGKKRRDRSKTERVNECVDFTKVDQTFQGDFPTVAQYEKKYLRSLISMLSVQAGLNMMFEVKKEETEVKLSKWNDCVKFRKFGQTFHGDFPTVAQSENKLFPHAYFNVERSGRPTQDV